jgi:hypothetical protein
MDLAIDLLELQVLYDYNNHTVKVTIPEQVYPREYKISSQNLTELKKIPCCRKCFIPGRRKYKSNAERISAKKFKIVACETDSSEDES